MTKTKLLDNPHPLTDKRMLANPHPLLNRKMNFEEALKLVTAPDGLVPLACHERNGDGNGDW